MYMRGLSDIGDDTDPYPVTFTPMDAPAFDSASLQPPMIASDAGGNYYSIPSSGEIPTANGSSSSWTDLFSAALKTYGAINVADTQAKTAQNAQQYQYATQLAARGYPSNGLRLPGQTYPPGYTPFPAVRPATSPISTPVILAVIGLGAAALYFS